MYRRRVGWFFENYGIEPGELLNASTEDLHALFLTVVGDLERGGRSGSYAQSIVTALRSWLTFNGITIARPIKIRGVQDNPTLADERVPTQEELGRVFEAANIKTRAICALLSQAGLRPQVLGNYYRTDGLRVGDLPDLGRKGRWVEFKREPAMLVVRPSLSKKANQYFTFLSADACTYLKAYLNRRLKHGEQLDADSPIITSTQVSKPFIRTTNISDAARIAIRKAGFQWRPYALRSYFATQMMVAESQGSVLRDYRVFFMGHKGDIEAVYTLAKRSLPERVVEEMRTAYGRAQQYLQPGVSGKSADTRRKDLFTKSQILVPFEELDQRMEEGWLFMALLPDNRVVLQRPAL